MCGTQSRKPILYSLVLMVFTLPGCTGTCSQRDQMKKLSKDPWMPKVALWPEFQNIIGGGADPSVPHIGRLARISNMGTSEDRPSAGEKPYCVVISNPKFQENIKLFADTPVPKEFSNEEREANKKALVDALNDLKDSCSKKVSEAAMDEKVKKIIKLKDDIYTIPGQTRPQGREAEKYAPE